MPAIQDQNRELARRINDEAREPGSPYFGKFVGIVRGSVAVVADNLDELGRALDRLSPDPSETFCIEAGRDYNQSHDIWSDI